MKITLYLVLTMCKLWSIIQILLFQWWISAFMKFTLNIWPKYICSSSVCSDMKKHWKVGKRFATREEPKFDQLKACWNTEFGADHRPFNPSSANCISTMYPPDLWYRAFNLPSAFAINEDSPWIEIDILDGLRCLKWTHGFSHSGSTRSVRC